MALVWHSVAATDVAPGRPTRYPGAASEIAPNERESALLTARASVLFKRESALTKGPE